MKNSSIKGIFGVLTLASAVLGANGAFADGVDVMPTCKNLPLVLNSGDFAATYGSVNETICVDVPVAFTEAKVIFNLDAAAIDGKGRSKGLKHLYMFGTAVYNRMNLPDTHPAKIDPADVAIVGIFHGAAAPWARKDAHPVQKALIEKIYALKDKGVNIQLELCGVNMRSNNWTKDMLNGYDAEGNPDPLANGRIYVNQGAVGRMLALQNRGFAYLHEGFEFYDDPNELADID